MKKGILFTAVVIMVIAGITYAAVSRATRESLYQKDQQKVMEAMVLVMTDELNELRTKDGLAAKSVEEVETAMLGKINTMADYEWRIKMNEKFENRLKNQ